MDKHLTGKSIRGDVAHGARGQRCTQVQLASKLHMSEPTATPSPSTSCPLRLRGAHVRDVQLAGETRGSRRILLSRGDLLEKSDSVGGKRREPPTVTPSAHTKTVKHGPLPHPVSQGETEVSHGKSKMEVRTEP